MILAENGIICDKKWEHDKNIKNCNGDTVESIMRRKGINVSE